MLTIRDYDGTEYPLLAVKVVNSELNGQEDIELTIHQQSNNSLDLKSVDKLWEIDYQNITYKIVYVKQQTRGSSFYLNVRATPLFYWEFDKSIIHEDNDGSHTANSAFRTVFEGTNYNFVLVDFSPSVTIEGFGKGSTRLELFKRLLDRYNYEFTINGSTVTMRHLVGNDTNFMYKYKLNASNVSRSTDATAMFTHIKGFGNFEEGEEDYFNNAQLKREFTSPLADIVGKWEGPPIVDGRMTQQSTLDSVMQKAVEDSLEISVEGTLHDIRQMGYDIAVPIKGDRVWLLDERINLEQEIRVYSVKTTYDERDNIIDCEVTFGSQSIRDRHKANINSLSKNFRDLLTGKLKLPVISLEQIGMDMINAIHAASSEIIFGDFGMQAISKTNPNHVFGVNSEGWYISQDGGRTPRTVATAQGIYADALFAGTLWLTNDLNIEGVEGYLNISSQRFTMKNHDGTNSTVIEPGRIQMNKSDFELGGGTNMIFTDPGNKVQYSRYDSTDGYARVAGMGVGNAVQNRYPFAYLGTYAGASMDTLGPHFSGLFVNTISRIRDNNSANSIMGQRFRINRDQEFSDFLEFDMMSSVNEIKAYGTWDLGAQGIGFRRGYINNIRGANDHFNITYAYDGSRLGYRFELTSGASSGNAAFRPEYGNELFYNLGTSTHVWRRGYINVLHYNTLEQNSLRELKDSIEDLDVEDAKDYIRNTDIQTFYYKAKNDDNPRTEYDMKVGIVHDDINIGKDYLIKSSESTVDQSNITFMIQSVVKDNLTRLDGHETKIERLERENAEMKEEIKQLKLDADNQNLRNELNSLKEEIEKLKGKGADK